MSTAEVCIKIGDAGDKRRHLAWRDGQPISIKPSGVSLTAEEYEAWVWDDLQPTRLIALCSTELAEHRRMARRIRWVLSGGTPEQLCAIRGLDRRNAEHRRICRDQIISTRQVWESVQGVGWYDTAWGFEDLRIHAVVLVDLDHTCRREWTTEPTSEAVHPMAPRVTWGRRPVRLRYEAVLSPATVSAFRDKERRVAPPRDLVEPIQADRIEEYLEPDGVEEWRTTDPAVRKWPVPEDAARAAAYGRRHASIWTLDAAFSDFLGNA